MATTSPGPTKGAASKPMTIAQYIAYKARLLGLDPSAVLGVAYAEGGFAGTSSTPGDHGTSFGPFQLHKGGALPPQAGNQGGQAAISSIISGFEKPGDFGAGIKAGLSPDAAARQTRDFRVASAAYNNFNGIASASFGTAKTDAGSASDFTSAGANVVPGAVGAVTGTIGSIGKLISWITNGKNITRIGEVILGVILILLGLAMIGFSTRAGATAAKAAAFA